MASRQWHRPSLLAVVLIIAGVAVFTRLGFWQIARMQEKRTTLDTVAAVLVERKTLPLAQIANDSKRTSDYDWAAGSGTFADADPILLDDQIRNGRVGIRVYRAFHAEDDRSSNATILIDMGWLPLPANRAMPKLETPVSDRLEVRGLLSPPPSSGIALGAGIAHTDNSWIATRMDLVSIGSNLQAQLAPRVLRLDPALPLGYERDLEVLPNAMPPERHLGYAVQWFALAFASIVIFIALHWRKAKKLKVEK
jgi:surfeit locus 1 family protein